MTLRELREKRGRIVTQMRALMESGDLSDEQRAQWDAMWAESEKLKDLVERAERQAALDREIAGAPDNTQSQPAPEAPEARQMTGFRAWLQHSSAHAEEQAEFRALSQGIAVDGGVLVTPQAFVAALIQAVDDMVAVRRFATIWPMPAAHSLGIPSLDSDPADADWTTELQTGGEDSSMKFGKREMRPHPVAKRIKVSKALLRNSTLPAETIVRQRLTYKFGVTLEKGYMTGTGAQQPLGLFTASNDGIPTGRDVSTGNTADAIGADNLMETKYAVKAQYQRTGRWLMHRDAVKQIAKLKDGEGRYLWLPSVRDGEPDTILGRPLEQSEFAPNTFTTGKYVGLFGDLSQYWIADSMALTIDRLNELYAETNQVGFIGRYEGDGAPVLAEAFARMKLA